MPKIRPLLPENTLHWMEHIFGSQTHVKTVRPLPGSTSSTLYRITLSSTGKSWRCVLRLFTNAEWLQVEPDIPIHEARALQLVHAAALPVPEFIALDESGAHCGVPGLLMSEVPGQVDLTPTDMESWLRQQADFLPRLHAINAAEFNWQYRPYANLETLAPPIWSKQPQLWQKAIEIVRSPAPVTPVCFIHRDYHPVNVLWQHGRLSGVIDWVNSCLGPTGIDVGWCRHNLAGAFGVTVADRFLDCCRSALGSSWQYHPYWDLITLIELLPGPIEVYPPWYEFGLTHLTNALVTQRTEDYLISLLRKF